MSQGVTVRHSAWYHVFLWTALPLLGALGGWLVTLVPGWVEGLAWVPFQGPIELADRAMDTVGRLDLDDDDLVVRRERAERADDRTEHDDVTTIARRDLAAVFLEGKDLVLTDARGAELARRAQDHEAKDLRDAFTRMQYPWHDGHPFEEAYARWVPGMPGLPEGADAYLRERQVALEKGRGAEVRELRRALARLGVFVRDVKKKQYWRSVGQA